jgi:hypothetical protein
MNPSQLKVGDRIWITAAPGEGVEGYHLFSDTLRVYRKIIKRHRPVRICKIHHGFPWFRVVETYRGKRQVHSLCILPGETNWRPVKRKKTAKV